MVLREPQLAKDKGFCMGGKGDHEPQLGLLSCPGSRQELGLGIKQQVHRSRGSDVPVHFSPPNMEEIQPWETASASRNLEKTPPPYSFH